MSDIEQIIIVIAGLNLLVGIMNMKNYFHIKNGWSLFWGVVNLLCFAVQCISFLVK